MKMGDSQTSQFLKQWHEGNAKGLEGIIDRHLDWIHAQVHQRLSRPLRNKGETCDYVQDILVQFLRFSPRFVLSSEAQFRALLLRIVENALNDKYDWYTARRREIARERPLPSDTILSLDPPHGTIRTPSKSAEQHEREAWIRLGLELLDPDDREILALRQWDDLSFPEIGEELGIAANTARMRHNRAIVRLTDKILALKQGELDQVL
jgi:RNA polymerase sigma-70 factor (ECF subfamily)